MARSLNRPLAPWFRACVVLLGVVVPILPSFAVSTEDVSRLDAAMRAGEFGPVNSLLIQQDGVLLYEGYYRGHHRDRLQLLNSVTKSVGSALIGMAHRRGLLREEQTVETLLPQYDWESGELRPHRALTLDQILQMRHGIQWDEWTHGFTDPRNSAVQMFASDDWYRFTLTRPASEPAGTQFRYSSGVSTLMSGILREATGEAPQDLFAAWFAAPLGIPEFDWELWSPDGPGTGRRNFPFGDAPLGVGLWLRPIDLVKIGQLYLDGGMFNGQRLLDREWIEASWQRYSRNDNDPQFANASEPAGYGYQWWFRELKDARGRGHACWYGDGAGRQYLIVCPDLELVVVSTGDSYAYQGQGVFTLLREHVLPVLDPPVDETFSGYYYDPATSGQGLNVVAMPGIGQVAATWYTFDRGAQRWYVMLGGIQGNAVQFDEVLRSDGGEFLGANGGQTRSVGSARLVWSSCRRAVLEFDIEQGTGTYPLQRLDPGCD